MPARVHFVGIVHGVASSQDVSVPQACTVKTPRLFIEDELDAGLVLTLADAPSHYLQHVMRRGPGDEILLFNGRDGEWRAEISQAVRKAVQVAVKSRTRKQTVSPDVWLLFAPVKRAPVDAIAAKATELGVRALQPVITKHTVAARLNETRMQSHLREAAEQCGRLDMPDLFPARPLVDVVADWPAGRQLLVCDETGAGSPVFRALSASGLDGASDGARCAAILIGPEGGFAADELDALGKLPFVTRISLGPRILRADTAVLAALACWQAASGDWF